MYNQHKKKMTLLLTIIDIVKCPPVLLLLMILVNAKETHQSKYTDNVLTIAIQSTTHSAKYKHHNLLPY